MRAAICLTLLLLAQPLSAAESKFDPDQRARSLAGLIEEETFALVRIDWTRIDPDALSKIISRAGWLKPVKSFRTAFLEAGGTTMTASFSTEEVPGISFLAVPLSDKSNVPALTALLKPLFPAGAVVKKRDSVLLAGPAEAVERLAKGKPSDRAELPAAVKAAGDKPVSVLLLPTADQRRVIEEALKLPLPRFSSRVLTRGVLWAALGLDPGDKPAASLTLHSSDDSSAKKLAELIEAGIAAAGAMKFFGEEKPFRELFPKDFDSASEALKPKVGANEVTVRVSTLDAFRAIARLASAIELRLGGGPGSPVDRNLRKIVRAMHRYHTGKGTFPAQAITDKEGRPLLSWRVALLPYLGEEKLYKEFHLDEPWDSPHNKKLIARMPAVYRDPRSDEGRPGLTTYLAPVHKEFIFTGGAKGTDIKEVADGTSNTAIVVDAKEAVVWTKPADLAVQKKDPWKGLLGHFPGFAVVGLADGVVVRIPRAMKPESLWALFTRAGGETLPKLRP